jgi:hypothetical protein
MKKKTLVIIPMAFIFVNVHAPLLATEKFQLPSDIPPSLDDDRKGWGLCYHFGKKVNFMPHFSS